MTDVVETYQQIGKCRDLPELIDGDSEGIVFLSVSGSIERVIAAVRRRQAKGAFVQEKIDGCWCAMKIGAGGRVESVTSRAGLHLRVAVGWIGETLQKQLSGWTLIGEVEAGTHWAHEQREREELETGSPVRIPRLHLYGALDVQGRVASNERVRRLGQWVGHDRIQNVKQAAWGEDWESFARGVFEAGGEGVVIRDADGIWKAKPRLSVDRYISKVFLAKDHQGHLRSFAKLSVCTSTSGKRPTFRVVQTVLVPEGVRAPQLRGRVVVVVGSTEDQKTGVVRHARIVEIRELGDKAAVECRIGQLCHAVPTCANEDQDDPPSETAGRGASGRGVELSRGRDEAGDEPEHGEQDIEEACERDVPTDDQPSGAPVGADGSPRSSP